MQEDFHYYATYCAAIMAGYTPKESRVICYSAQFVDLCSKTFLASVKGPRAAATTQISAELVDQQMDLLGVQEVTRIWASFHFLPYDLYAPLKRKSKAYKMKYRMICNSNGDLLVDTVNLAKGKSLQAVGIAMHVLADTWAHKNFAGTPSMVINNTDSYFFEVMPAEEGVAARPIRFVHNPGAKDDIENATYVNSIPSDHETNVMNLGHGRAGHLPDYSFIRYKYMPAWGNYKTVLKDNPSDYLHAFAQMVYAMKYLLGEVPEFEKEQYAWDVIAPFREEIEGIFAKRQLDDSADWKAFGEKISGEEIPDFDLNLYKEEYKSAEKDQKDGTFIGKFILGALAQKSMVTAKIYHSGNPLAGISVDYEKNGFRGIKDYLKLIDYREGGGKND